MWWFEGEYTFVYVYINDRIDRRGRGEDFRLVATYSPFSSSSSSPFKENEWIIVRAVTEGCSAWWNKWTNEWIACSFGNCKRSHDYAIARLVWWWMIEYIYACLSARFWNRTSSRVAREAMKSPVGMGLIPFTADKEKVGDATKM